MALPWGGAVAECCPVPQPAPALGKQCNKTTWNPVLVFVPQLNQGLRWGEGQSTSLATLFSQWVSKAWQQPADHLVVASGVSWSTSPQFDFSRGLGTCVMQLCCYTTIQLTPATHLLVSLMIHIMQELKCAQWLLPSKVTLHYLGKGSKYSDPWAATGTSNKITAVNIYRTKAHRKLVKSMSWSEQQLQNQK